MKDRNMPAQGNKTGRAPLTYDLISKYRSALMGLAIISILIFHFTDDCRIYQTKFEGIIYYYNMLISSAGVDAFLALSGFGLYYSMKRKPVFQRQMDGTPKHGLIERESIWNSLKQVRDAQITTTGRTDIWEAILALLGMLEIRTQRKKS